MKRRPKIEERTVRASASDVVSFSVVCTPWTGASIQDMQRRLSLRTVKEFQPDAEARRRVATQLRELGFEVFESPGPVITARGPVERFNQVFARKVQKRIRKMRTPGRRRVATQISLELPERAPILKPPAVPDALLVTVARKPTPAVPSLPPAVTGRNLHLPGDIAQLMMASATHRRSLPNGDRATGHGVTVAVVDTGFAYHPYYREHGYRITRLAASDASDAELDEAKHGTALLAGLFACAPDAHALAVKYGDNPVTALNDATAHGGVGIVSLSWGYDLEGLKTLPDTPLDLADLALTILSIVQSGVTVVAAAGNGDVFFPAMMPDVIAVGGVTVDDEDALLVWNGASSFRSTIYKGRDVPDVCGIATDALLPFREPDEEPDWESQEGGTSMATAQVAGIAALLLQKNTALTPSAVREHLTSTALDVASGTSAMGHRAKKGPDLATGAGLASTLAAWHSVV